jgi:hypothetical protein
MNGVAHPLGALPSEGRAVGRNRFIAPFLPRAGIDGKLAFETAQ